MFELHMLALLKHIDRPIHFHLWKVFFCGNEEVVLSTFRCIMWIFIAAVYCFSYFLVRNLIIVYNTGPKDRLYSLSVIPQPQRKSQSNNNCVVFGRVSGVTRTPILSPSSSNPKRLVSWWLWQTELYRKRSGFVWK